MNGTLGEQDASERRRTTLVGGYSSTTQIKNDSNVQDAANFVLEQLRIRHRDYSFTLSSSPTSAFNIVVLDSQQQVVAGMNYKLKLGIFNSQSNQCLGGLACIVYRDLQGKYTVTSFGEEISCQAVLAMRSISSERDSDEEEEEDLE